MAPNLSRLLAQSLAQRLRNLSYYSSVDLSFPSAFGCKVVVYSCMRHSPPLFTPIKIDTHPSLPFNTPDYPTTRTRLNASGESKVDISREERESAVRRSLVQLYYDRFR